MSDPLERGRPEDYAEVLVFGGVGRSLTYRVGNHQDPVTEGSLVSVPLRKRFETGVVLRIGVVSPVEAGKIRPIARVLQPYPVCPPDLARLAHWMADYYVSSSSAVMESMIPAPIRKGMRHRERLVVLPGSEPEPEDWDRLEKRAPRQWELLRLIRQQSVPLAKATLLQRLKASDSSLQALVKRGWVVQRHQVEERVAYGESVEGDEVASAAAPQLNDEQTEAASRIGGLLDSGRYGTLLLHGVTGSGKTEVYLAAMERVVEEGGGVLFLVPEISLAPQTVGRVRARFEARGITCVVWHSNLSEGERADAWYAVASGRARVVVGARSAVFAPLADLRLIIVDEEHEPTYKQSESPRYHGRDVAVYRAWKCGAVSVLGSATPSLESLLNVRRKQYEVARLTKRIDDRQMPLVHIVDMRREVIAKTASPLFSRLLIEKMRERVERGEQSILFLNRRGFSTSMICPDCGWVAECESCDIPLTYHRYDQTLKCHLCGHEEPAPTRCPKCGSSEVRGRGKGTQRIESVVAEFFPKARIVRVDADTMAKRKRLRRVLGDFRLGRIDILIGTQMIAKGLDFPNVTLVGLVDADLSLHQEDFRAAERTFQLLVQVAGRAGRGDRSGEVVVQTHTPHADPIQFARRRDFEGFLDGEIEQREAYHYPPFRHLIRHVFKGRNPDKVRFYAEKWAETLEKEMGEAVEIRGPVEAPLAKLRGEYRFHLWYFVGKVSPVAVRLRELRAAFPRDPDVADLIDVDAFELR